MSRKRHKTERARLICKPRVVNGRGLVNNNIYIKLQNDVVDSSCQVCSLPRDCHNILQKNTYYIDRMWFLLLRLLPSEFIKSEDYTTKRGFQSVWFILRGTRLSMSNIKRKCPFTRFSMEIGQPRSNQMALELLSTILHGWEF